jgi:enamine deaminase RidA (YjgF/YER057c/UK114 family)
MSGTVAARLAALGLTLPEPGAPVANYIPFTRSGSTIYVSGQIPRKDGAIWPVGIVGRDVALEVAQEGARIAFLSILAIGGVAAGGALDRLRLLRLTGYVACTPEFGQQPLVINGASDLAVALLGEAGRHARSAVGVAALPGGAAVEVEGIFELG